MGWLLVPLAFAAMALQDIVCVVMVRAETSGRAHLAAAGDTLQDALGLASLAAVGGSLLISSDVPLSACVIGARLAGDYAGDLRRGAARGAARQEGGTVIPLWHWLYDNGLPKDALGTAVAIGGAHLVGWRPRRHLRAQEKIADRLDTTTPGGLGDLVKRKGEQ